ncbi:unnamed protein product [Cuscuta campestris]|uniref:Uncharacterized protein n=1 Tax=Cuscuta campestris TaxID=132261 RepID=A0A484LH37_9ASTE|nr:unnamed protein product [Cuscuta campestris]
MKVSFTCNESVNSKTATATTTTAAAAASYEPKSVLELRRSPVRPSLDSDDPLQLADHVLANFEEWDSLMKDLGLKSGGEDFIATAKPTHDHQNNPSESTQFSEFQLAQNSLGPADFQFFQNLPPPPPPPPDHNHQFLFSDDASWNLTAFDYVDELIRFADCFDTDAAQLAQVILARLNHKLRSPTGKPLERAAFYFKESLQSLLTWSTRMATRPGSSEIVQTIKAYNIFSNISPVPMFSSFTANQAVLEAVNGSPLVHVIDFDIGLGGHWASFMKELADLSARAKPPPALRITALVPDEYAVESRLIRENLTQFARDLNLAAFEIDFVLINTFELLSFKAVKFMDGEKTAVILSPYIFRKIGAGFVADLRRISPHVVVHVDSEGLVGFGTSSFRQSVIEGLEFYSTLLESLEAAANVGRGGGGGDWLKKIETYVLYPKIMEMVGAAGRRGTPWREAFVAAGFRPVLLSQFADFQAECLLGRVQVRGFHVAKRQAEMLLCWNDRALVATSAWR